MVLKSGAIFGLLAALVGIYQFFLKTDCHSQFNFPIKYLATKSPYVVNDKLLYNFNPKDKTVNEMIPEGCTAEKIWIVARHGTRNPSEKIINKMLSEVGKLREEILLAHRQETPSGQLCERELSAIQNWKADLGLEPSKEKWLVPQGEVELQGIGSRFKKAFPQVFVDKYHPDVYKFKYTKTQRAEASAKNFARGVFGREEALRVEYPPALDADPVLRFYKACPRWKKHVDKNPATYEEQKKFESAPLFKSMLGKLQARLGLTRPLTIPEVELMYQACSFETAWTPDTPSPWCGVFEEGDLQLLEYRQDLEYYWVDGYGHELTYKQACAPVGDIIQQFKQKIDDSKSAHKVTAYFTHSGTLLKFISHLGLFNDTEPLRSDNYDLHKNSRLWRTSFIDKFATNVAFVLFKCSDQATKAEVHKIGALFQEHPVSIPCCNGDWICPFSQFLTSFENSVRTCSQDVSAMCQL